GPRSLELRGRGCPPAAPFHGCANQGGHRLVIQGERRSDRRMRQRRETAACEQAAGMEERQETTDPPVTVLTRQTEGLMAVGLSNNLQPGRMVIYQTI